MFELEPTYRYVNSISTYINYGAEIFEDAEPIIATYGPFYEPPETFGD